MNAAPPLLADVGVLVTRPSGQAGGLVARIEAAGGRALVFPALEIAPPADERACAHAIAELPAWDFAIFVSPTSVEATWPLIAERHGGWPSGVAVAAVGQGSARALGGHGVAGVLVAEDGADSESLLALDAFEDMTGKRVLIVRGEGGRELLAEALRARGAEVGYAECYRRRRPDADPGPLIRVWREGGIDAVTVTSREAFANLAAMLGDAGRDLLRTTPLFAPHARIADAAREWGVTEAVATPPGDAGLVSGLSDWFNRDHD